MSEENKTLNRGLDALLGQNNAKQRSVKEVDLLKIKPGRFQPRSNFDNEKDWYKWAEDLKYEKGIHRTKIGLPLLFHKIFYHL